MIEKMEMYRVTMNNMLCHHGIKGQEWGVRNGPPYPLDSDDHSAKEKSMHRNERSDSVSKGLTDEQKKKILKSRTCGNWGYAWCHRCGVFGKIWKIKTKIC